MGDGIKYLKVALYHRAYRYADTPEMVAKALAVLDTACKEQFGGISCKYEVDWVKEAPGLHRLIVAFQAGEIETIYCYNLSRIFSCSIDGTVTGLKVLERIGIPVVFHDHRQLDTVTLGLLSNHQAFLQHLRGKATMGMLNEKGSVRGRPKRPIKGNPETLNTVDMIRDFRERGWSWRKIGKAIGLPRSTVFARGKAMGFKGA